MAMSDGRLVETDRGQTYTLEAVIAFSLLAVTIAFGVPTLGMASPITPETAETTAAIERDGTVILDASVADGSVKEAALMWDGEAETFADPSGTPTVDGHFVSPPDGDFGDRIRGLQRNFDVGVNVYLVRTEDERSDYAGGTTRRSVSVPLLKTGEPTREIVVISKPIVLYECDRFYSNATAHAVDGRAKMESGDECDELEDSHYPIPSADSEQGGNGEIATSRLYNVIDVEVVIWYA